MSEVIAITSASRMSKADYEAKRDKIRATFGTTGRSAGAHLDQALAALFHQSGWTQEQLADFENQKRPYIARRLLFGRFLEFVPAGTSPITKTLTERRFRDYWARTPADRKEHQRFVEVRDKLLNDVRVGRSTLPKKPIGEAIKKTCADGKWHGFSVIVQRVQTLVEKATPEDVEIVLHWIVQRSHYGLTGAKRQGGNEWAYKLTKSGRYLPYETVLAEVGPLLDQLEIEGRRNQVAASPSTVARLTFLLRQAFERLATDKKGST